MSDVREIICYFRSHMIASFTLIPKIYSFYVLLHVEWEIIGYFRFVGSHFYSSVISLCIYMTKYMDSEYFYVKKLQKKLLPVFSRSLPVAIFQGHLSLNLLYQVKCLYNELTWSYNQITSYQDISGATTPIRCHLIV